MKIHETFSVKRIKFMNKLSRLRLFLFTSFIIKKFENSESLWHIHNSYDPEVITHSVVDVS